MTHDEALEFVRQHTRAVLATIKRDGRPQLSHVSYTLDDDGIIKISVTGDRAKTRNLLRDPRATLSIIDENWSKYLVVEGICTVIQDDPVPVLRRVYEHVPPASCVTNGGQTACGYHCVTGSRETNETP